MIRLLFALCLALLMWACEGSSIPTSPSPPARSPTFTLAGVVSEATPAGSSPIAGASLQIGVCPPNPQRSAPSYLRVVTDENGFYQVTGMCAGTTHLWVGKEGYTTLPGPQCDGDCLFVQIAGDTRFDIELVRQ
jgi:hypothetical protein